MIISCMAGMSLTAFADPPYTGAASIQYNDLQAFSFGSTSSSSTFTGTLTATSLPYTCSFGEILGRPDFNWSDNGTITATVESGTNVTIDGSNKTVTINDLGTSTIKIVYEETVGSNKKTFTFTDTITVTVPAHTHSWSITASGTTATVKCTAEECPYTTNTEYTATISAEDKVYDGNAVTATITKSTDFPTEITTGDNDSSTTAPKEIGTYTASATINGDNTKVISVDFAITAQTYSITVTNGTSDKATAEAGATVTITATVPEGKAFDKWTTTDVDGLNESTTNPTTFTMPAKAVTVTANFKNVYTVTVTNDGHGTATVSPTSGSEGTEVTLTATPATGYKFKEWSVISGGVTIANNKFTIGTENVEIKAIFEAKPVETYSVTVVGGTSDKATAEAGETVTITATVPDGKEFVNWTTSDVEGLNGSTAATTTFTMPAKTVTVTANFKDKSSGGGGYTPVIPSYTPTTTTTPTTTNTGNLENTTDEKKNDNGASLESSNDELNKAVLTDADRAAMAKGENIQVYLEVEEKKPTKAEQQKAEEALVEIDEGAEIAMYMDMNLFKKVGSNAPVQIHEVNGKLEVGFKVPEKFINNDPDTQRTFYIGHIKDDGTVEIIKCEFDPETGIATFLTDSFSCYFLMFEDAKADDVDVSAVDDDDEQGDEGAADDDDEQFDEADDDFDELTDDEDDFDDDFAEDQTDGDSDTDNDDQAAVDAVVDNGETNPNTGASAGFGLLAVCALTAGAAVAVKKRKK